MTLLPHIRRARSEYYVTSYDYAVDGSTNTFRIPALSQSGGLRDVVYIDSNGNGASIPRIPLEDRDNYAQGASISWPIGLAFCVQGDKVVLLPSDAGSSASFTLRLRYYRRPSRLILSTSAALITDIDGADYTASGGANDVDNGDSVDVIEANPNFDWLETAQTVSVAGTLISFQQALTSGAAVGDYIAETGTTPVVQLPEGLHPVLTNAVTVRVFELLGNSQAAGVAQAKLDKALANVESMIEPRIEGEEVPIFSRWSPLRCGRWR